MADYKYEDDIFSEEDTLVHMTKAVIWKELSEVDRRVILLYAELGSQRELGKALGLSASTANKLIKEIRKKIYEHLRINTADSAYSGDGN